jgi:alpha,alpha-trehalase
MSHITNDYRFGWVNASYVYGLQHVDAHCQRALGTLSTWEQLHKQRATIFEKDENSDEEDINDKERKSE